MLPSSSLPLMSWAINVASPMSWILFAKYNSASLYKLDSSILISFSA